MLLDRPGARTPGRQDNDQGGINDDGHLRRCPQVEVCTALPDKLHHIDRLSLRQAATQSR
ncbi:MAG TPA: hypothetical protein VKF37_14840 [Chloroflexota bacterium]|nr:hypothetical protein [Chloroflexota bacterium]